MLLVIRNPLIRNTQFRLRLHVYDWTEYEEMYAFSAAAFLLFTRLRFQQRIHWNVGVPFSASMLVHAFTHEAAKKAEVFLHKSANRTLGGILGNYEG